MSVVATVDRSERAKAVIQQTWELADCAAADLHVVHVDETLEFEPVGLVGDPAAGVLEYSRTQDAVYIVVSARKLSPLGQTIFGSGTQTLLLAADIPVVAVPDPAE